MENALFLETSSPTLAEDTSRDTLSNIDENLIKTHESKSTNGNQKLEENFDFASDIIDLLLYVENDQTTRHNIESIIDQWDEMNILNEDGSKSIVNFETNKQIKIKNILHTDDVVSECADVRHYTITVQNNNANHPLSNQSINSNEPIVSNLNVAAPPIELPIIKRTIDRTNDLTRTEADQCTTIDQTSQCRMSIVSSCPASSTTNFSRNDIIQKSINEDAADLTARIKALFCKMCNRNFEQLLFSGQIKKIPSKPFPCPFCRGNYYHKSSADIHMKVHMQEDELKCRLCTNNINNVVVRKTTTTADEMKPIEKRPKLNANCGLCSATFETQFELAKHVSVVHNKVTCRRLVARRTELCRCRNTDENLSETTTYCGKCSLRKQRNFECKNCAKLFADKLIYNLHCASCVGKMADEQQETTADTVPQHCNILDHSYGKPIMDMVERANNYKMIVDSSENEMGSQIGSKTGSMIVNGINTMDFGIETDGEKKTEIVSSSDSSVITDNNFMNVDTTVFPTTTCPPFLAVADSTHDTAVIIQNTACASSTLNDNTPLPETSTTNGLSKILQRSDANFDSSLAQQSLDDMGNIIEQYLHSQEGQKMLVDDFNTCSTYFASAQAVLPRTSVTFAERTDDGYSQYINCVDSNTRINHNDNNVGVTANSANVVSHELAGLINDGSAICLNNVQASISTSGGSNQPRLNVFESNALSTQVKNYLVLHVLPTSDTKLNDKLPSTTASKTTYLIPIVPNANAKMATFQFATQCNDVEKFNQNVATATTTTTTVAAAAATNGRDILQMAYDDACKPATAKFYPAAPIQEQSVVCANMTTAGNYALLKQMLAKPCLPVATFECEICHVKLAKSEQLSHLKSHNRTLYKCTYCHEIYLQQLNLIEHMQKMHSQQPQTKTYDCKMCEKSFANVLLYRLHTLVHKGLLFICVSCVKLFNKRDDYEEHLKTHQSNSLTCVGCKRNFLNAVNGSNMIRCFTCIECISSRSARQSEMLTVTKNSKFNSTRPGQLQILNHCGEELIEEFLYECRYCNLICDGGVSFRAHYDKHISTEIKCYLCDIRFDRFTTLEAHLNTHNGAKSIECPSCLNLFEDRDSFRNHSHANFRPHGCVLCDQSFAQKCDLIRHWNGHVHAANVEYVCNFCGSKLIFDNIESILTHKTSHQKAPIIECHNCDVKFISALELQNHRLMVHVQESKADESMTNRKTKTAKLSCKFCDSSFAEFNDLLSHSIKYHADCEFKCYKCSCCGRFFTTESHWLEHKESDKSTLLPYSLKQFGDRLFKLEPDRKIAYNCHQCDKTFAKKNDVSRHICSTTKVHQKL